MIRGIMFKTLHARLVCRPDYVLRLAGALVLWAGGFSVMAGTVVGWGNNSSGELTFPASSNDVVAVAAGLNSSLLLHSNGNVTALGTSYSGPPMPTDLTNVVAVSGSAAHNLVLRSDSTVSAWGEGFPKAFVPAGISNVVAVRTGFEHSLVLKSDGTVDGWGGYWGSTNDGPHVVPASVTNAVAIAAGGGMSLALNQDGTVVTWGGFSVPTDLTNVAAIAVGGYHALALRSNGTVVAWGDNSVGQSEVPPDLTNAVAIAAGWYHSLALTAEGKVVAWGYNHGGQLNIPAGLSNVVAIAAGYTHSLAVVSEDAPQIAQSPMDQTAIAGSTALFVASASGALPMDYHWRGNGTNLAFSAGATLVLANVQPSQAGTYSVVASNAHGSVESAGGTLTVIPFILTSPTNQTAYVGDAVTLRAPVKGSGPFSYQWRWNGTNLVDGTNAMLVLPGVVADQSGNYAVLVTNIYGAVESSNAVLTILDSAPFFVKPPASIITWPGATTGFQPVVDGTKPLYFQWRFQGTPILGGTNASLMFEGASGTLAGAYTLFASNVTGTLVSSPVTLTVLPVAAWGSGAVTNLPVALTNAVHAAVGSSHGLGLKPNGSVVSWGSLTTVPANATNVATLAAANQQSLALRSNGTVAAWGTIVTVPGNATNVTAIAAGGYAGALGCLALKSNGTVVAWGNGANGLVNNLPVNLRGVTGIAAGRYHGLALLSDGTVTRWADGADGTLNAVPTNLANVVAVATRLQHSLALRADGTVAAWGANTFGQTNVPTGMSNVVAVAAGEDNCLALRRDGSIAIWGRNNYGQTNVPLGMSNVVEISGGPSCNLVRLGSTNTSIVRQPFSVTGVPRQPVLLSVGAVSSLSLTYQWQQNGTNLPGATNAAHRIPLLARSDQGGYRVLISASSGVVTSAVAEVALNGNSVVAWGTNNFGKTNVPFAFDALAVAGGFDHSLALRADGTIAAWGTPSFGVTTVPEGATNAIAIAAGTRHNLALKSDGKVVAWGDSSAGKTTVPAGLSNVRAVGAGDSFSLALKSDGQVTQWGSLAAAPAGLSNVVAVAAGYTHALAAKLDGTLLTWGSSAPAVPAGLTNTVAVAAGNGFSLALQADGTARAWGSNNHGQTNVPPGLSNVVALSAGGYAAHALKADGTFVTWGRNVAGLTNPPPGLSNVIQTTGGELHSLALVGSADPAMVRQPAPTNFALVGNRVLLSAGAISAAPLHVQWRHNGTNLIGATNASLILPAAQPANSGTYSATFSNGFGLATSANAFLLVTGAPPAILAQPTSVTNYGGETVVFQITASGTAPLTYQWRKNNAPLAAATNDALALTALRRTNQGDYSIVVSNQFGGITSSNATLRVLVPQLLAAPAFDEEARLELLFGDHDGGSLDLEDAGHFEVQASTNLTDWFSLTNSLSITNGRLLMLDANSPDHPHRFYRVLESP